MSNISPPPYKQQLPFNIKAFLFSQYILTVRHTLEEQGTFWLFEFHTWKSLSVVIGKYIRPRSLLMRASTPIFSLTSSAAVCSNPVGTVAPTVTVMMSPVMGSFSVEEGVGGPTVFGPCSAASSSWDDMLFLCTSCRGVTGFVSQLRT